MEYRSGGLLFTSKFDSGNLARVERVYHDEDDDPSAKRVGDTCAVSDYEFNVWTKHDCGGTEFENGNRSWFHFAIKGCPMNKLVKINVMNMNKQGKLYSQGMAPVVRVMPQKPKWERIRERPTWETVDGQFILSFNYRFEYRFSSVYFAFCFPYSYTECQQKMDELDSQFAQCQHLKPSSPANSIYYHRELLCYSIDRLRVDLMTITSCHGLTNEREPRLPKLFPENEVPRAHKFKGKRVFFLTSRVHPGETPASFVFNGFLEFILRPKDPRAIQLRKQYVFKLIPLLNPDGVQRGHYRTDQRGVNLNRVYLNPDSVAHPTIYATKSLILHHHVSSRVVPWSGEASPSSRKTDTKHVAEKKGKGDGEGSSSPGAVPVQPPANAIVVVHEGSGNLTHSQTVSRQSDDVDNQRLLELSDTDIQNSGVNISKSDFNAVSMPGDSADVSSQDASELRLRTSSVAKESSVDGDSGGEEDEDNIPHSLTPSTPKPNSDPNLAADGSILNIPPKDSGIALYVDLHGHASKRGCFIYGNYFDEEESHIDNLLFPKLISMNSAHFDFDGCNFTEKNMYTKDKRDGMSKEGSGRVAIFKATGIIHSYTLECNYNSGRFVNSLAPATMDDGRATPPPLAGYPPKYNPGHFEEVGRAVAVAALDITNTNPWSRLASTEYSNVMGVRSWVQRYLRSVRGAPLLPKKMARVSSKTSSIVASATANTFHKPRFSWSDTPSSQAPSSVHSNQSNSASSVATAAKKVTVRHLGPVRETKTTLERKKHLQHQMQGSKLASASVPAFGSTSLRSYPATNHSRQTNPNTINAPQQSSSLPVAIGMSTSHKSHKTSPQSLNTVAHPHEHGVTNPVTHGIPPPPIRHGFTLTEGRTGKHHKQHDKTAVTSNVVHELLSNVMIKALEETVMNQTRGVLKGSYVPLSPLPVPSSPADAQSLPGKPTYDPSDGGKISSAAMQIPTLAPALKVANNQKMLFRPVANNEPLSNYDLTVKSMNQRDSPSSEPVKRRKKPSGMKRRSASHSPSRKGRRTGRGRGSETDSEKDKKQSNRRKRGSIDGRTTRSEPVTGDNVPDYNVGPQNGHEQITLRRRSSDGVTPDLSHQRSKRAGRFTKSHSFGGENSESSVSCQVVDLNNVNNTWKSKKEVTFWM
ncbi:cytosolic carboxypeptidase-like protein 5 isoform X1 [Asterias rubens]|uniref:cytosolic carboxypeptidase-like protein 5 isoform X1 n=1 Tax=Asterias rubens TaxID=7604 RepID=UPI0014550B47|nr:cytosolic carboxypeptidase-like protein 5 isoform X1 [Asterias rubens]